MTHQGTPLPGSPRKRWLSGHSGAFILTHGHLLHALAERIPPANLFCRNIYEEQRVGRLLPHRRLPTPAVLPQNTLDLNGRHGQRGALRKVAEIDGKCSRVEQIQQNTWLKALVRSQYRLSFSQNWKNTFSQSKRNRQCGRKRQTGE